METEEPSEEHHRKLPWFGFIVGTVLSTAVLLGFGIHLYGLRFGVPRAAAGYTEAALLSDATVGKTRPGNHCFVFYLPNRETQNAIRTDGKHVDCSITWCDDDDETKNKRIREWLFRQGVKGLAYYPVWAESNDENGKDHAKPGYHYRVCDPDRVLSRESIATAIIDTFGSHKQTKYVYVEEIMHVDSVVIPFAAIDDWRKDHSSYEKP